MTTNREKLAKMTNEELARFLSQRGVCKLCSNLELLNFDCLKENCIEGITKWLNQESEE